jgi:integrase
MFVRIPGANIIDLQQLMGHSDVKTTLSYVGTSLKEKTKAVYQMPKVLGVEDGSFIETHETILVEN